MIGFTKMINNFQVPQLSNMLGTILLWCKSFQVSRSGSTPKKSHNWRAWRLDPWFWNGVWVECLKEEYCNDAPPTIGLDTFRGGRAFVSDRGKTAKTEAPSGMVWSIPWPVLGGSHCLIVLHMWMATRDFQKAFGPFLSSAEAIERHLLFDSGRSSTASGRLGETHARVLRTGAY